MKKCKITCLYSKQQNYFFTESAPIHFGRQSQEGLCISTALSTHTVPTSKTARLNSPTGPVCTWPHTEVVPCVTQQEVTQLLSHTHLVICLLQQRGAVFSYLPAKSIFCSHSWELYHWYRSLLPGVQSVFLLGCILCL